MDSISISNYRNFEQQTLKQNEAFTKELTYKKSVNFANPKKLSDEPVSVPEKANLFDEPAPQEGQKLNYLA